MLKLGDILIDMDVRKKFAFNLTILFTIVLLLGALVILFADRSPSEEDFEVETPAIEPSDQDVSSDTEDSSQTPQDNDTSDQSRDERPVEATITLSDNQTPERQLNPPSAPDTSRSDKKARYRVRLIASWSRQLHPHFYPDGAHLSPMVAWSHRLPKAIFTEGVLASDGMEIMAETGGTGTLVREIKDSIRIGSIVSYATGSVFDAPGEDETTISMQRDAPYITVVSMIAPSPDWFVTSRNIELYKDGRWLERLRVPATLYDSGTDSGEDFNSEDDDTDPPELITKIRDVPSIPIATFEFVKID